MCNTHVRVDEYCSQMRTSISFVAKSFRDLPCLEVFAGTHSSSMSTLGDRIKTRRLALGWTLDRLATAAHVSKSFLSDLENGNRKSAGGNYLKQIATAMSMSLDHLISGTPESSSDADVQIPASLAAFAKVENLSFSQTLMILKLRQQVVAFRNESGTDDFDWKPFYEAVKPFLK